MAYNAKMTTLPYKERAKCLEDLFKLDYGEASKDFKKYCLGGAATFACLSKKAISHLNSIDYSIVQAIASCYKANDWNKAYNLFRRVGLEKYGLVAEHTIPCSIVYEWAASDKSRQTRGAFEQLLRDGIFVQCGITSEEDFYLRQAGLNQKMPSTWNGTIDSDATFARYRAVKIVPVLLGDIK